MADAEQYIQNEIDRIEAEVKARVALIDEGNKRTSEEWEAFRIAERTKALYMIIDGIRLLYEYNDISRMGTPQERLKGLLRLIGDFTKHDLEHNPKNWPSFWG
jgi:hypothetical protein